MVEAERDQVTMVESLVWPHQLVEWLTLYQLAVMSKHGTLQIESQGVAEVKNVSFMGGLQLPLRL